MPQRSRDSGKSAGSRYGFAAVAFLVATALTAAAEGDVVERLVKAAPGRDVRVGIYTSIRPDCTSGPLPAIRLVTAPLHGAVTVKRGTLKATNVKQCLATEVPAFVAFYRAALGYNGADEFDLEISIAGRKQRQHFRVSVSNGAGGGGDGI